MPANPTGTGDTISIPDRPPIFAGMGSPAYVYGTSASAQVPGGRVTDDLIMTNQHDDSEGSGSPSQQARRERLKQALRENLKRRKSQIRQRGKLTPAPSVGHETPLGDPSVEGG
jgi:hypothetical protein